VTAEPASDAHSDGGPIRLALLSDLHLDIRRRHLVREGKSAAEADAMLAALQEDVRHAAEAADLTLVLGDVREGPSGIAWAADTFRDLPTIYVAGNHEFYRHNLTVLLRTMADTAAATKSLHFLENGAAQFEFRDRKLRVLGATLWTDYSIYDGAPAADAMSLAAATMYDHLRIAYGEEGIFQPADALALHRKSRAWLENELSRGFPGTTIVATHHAPSPRSIEPRFQGDRLSPAFGSDLEPLMSAHDLPLWLHGHTHYNVDYRIGGTRVVTHQWGYPQEGPPLGVKILEI
jgi:3',5'-cyclic AMP phosphodiesterase CpdA